MKQDFFFVFRHKVIATYYGTLGTQRIPPIAPIGIKVLGIKKGKATITATVGSKKQKCKVTVKTKAEGVMLEATSGKVYTTKGLYIKAKVVPEDASDKTITYTSSNTKVATVSSKGYVTGVGASSKL